MGDRCVIVEFGQRIDPDINRAARAFAGYLLAHPIEGVVDIVPGYTTVAIHYRPETFAAGTAPYQQFCGLIETMLASAIVDECGTTRLVEVPVCYGGEFGPDLPEVAAACGLAPDDLIALHAASPHIVYMLGFAPGFPYIGGLDRRLAVPRRATPRTKVPAGTVAIAGEQSAIYSLETPGGWNMIGRTPLTLFNPDADPPCLLQPGDEVRFVPISPQQYHDTQSRK
ncbi:MAG: 5-oxoprolinase subunit PxpB [Casimicrobiaceae bacterium]